MKNIKALMFVSALAITAMACQKDTSGVDKRLEQIDKRLASIEDAIKGVAAAGAARPAQAPPQRPPGPDAAATYAVPVGANTIVDGKPTAKVTIVEAFEFA